MQFIKKIIIALTLLISLITFAQSETTWITKKKDKSKKVEKVEKVEKKETVSSWIKKKKKENKKEFKKEKKKITKEVKSWIAKKTKDKYLATINDLPDGVIYFSGYNELRDILIHGYVEPDTKSELISGYHKTSKGYVYFNDGKTTCKIGSTVLVVIDGELTSRVAGECSNGLEFTGKTTQTNTSGDGYATASDGNKFFVNFDINKTKIAKLYEENKIDTEIIERKIARKEKKKIVLDPKGKYYALLIGNSKYQDKQWEQLVSPINDIRAISKILDQDYNFEEVITVENGSKKEILMAIQKLKTLSTTNDYVLVYYSGHGEIKAESAYWVPVDGGKQWGMGDWINISELDIHLKEIQAHHLAVLVDSCYVGGKFKGTNILDHLTEDQATLFGDSLIDSLNLRSRSVLSSGTTGRVTDTAPGSNHSLFAASLINTLKQFNKLSSPVNLQSIALNMKIHFAGTWNKPHLYSPPTWNDGGGDFIFIPKENIKK
tara:strand:+ start:138 stop:1607 length:1470 start_codon:yes stop_codon:yes gene_type:complete